MTKDDPFGSAPASKPRAAPDASKKIKGKDLTPDLSVPHGDTFAGGFWYGALPSLPVGVVSVGGVTFMQIAEDVSYNEATGETDRSPYIGIHGRLMASQLEAVKEALPRMVVRFTGPAVDEADRSVAENIGMKSSTARQGYVIIIPNAKEEEAMRAARRFRPYIPGRNDEPLADHIYIVKREGRGVDFPPPLSETGLE